MRTSCKINSKLLLKEKNFLGTLQEYDLKWDMIIFNTIDELFIFIHIEHKFCRSCQDILGVVQARNSTYEPLAELLHGTVVRGMSVG